MSVNADCGINGMELNLFLCDCVWGNLVQSNLNWIVFTIILFGSKLNFVQFDGKYKGEILETINCKYNLIPIDFTRIISLFLKEIRGRKVAPDIRSFIIIYYNINKLLFL